ncbi:MATE family efflux transporter [Vreelandella sp. TE19]
MHKAGALFTRGPIGRHVKEMAITSGLSLLALFLIEILTLTYVSLLKDEELVAAVGIGKLLMFFNTIAVTGIAITAGGLISRRVGRGLQASLPPLVTHVLILAVGVAVLVAAIEGYYLDHFIAWLGEGTASASVRPFLWMALMSSVLMAITHTCAQALRAVGHSRQALSLFLVAAGVLAIVDPVLIFVLELELIGAGIAMIMAAGVAGVYGLYRVKRKIGLASRIHWRLLKHQSLHIGRVTLPYTLGHLAMPFAITFVMGQLAVFGVSVMAGMALMDTTLQVAYCLYFALPGALVPVFAQHLDAHLKWRLKAALVSAIELVVVYGLLAWCALLVIVPVLATVFGLSTPGRHLLDDLSAFGPGLWLLMGLDFIAVAIFVTLERTGWVMFYAWLRASFGTVPFVVLGAKYFGASGVILGMWLGNAGIALISITTAVLLARRHFRCHFTQAHQNHDAKRVKVP